VKGCYAPEEIADFDSIERNEIILPPEDVTVTPPKESKKAKPEPADPEPEAKPEPKQEPEPETTDPKADDAVDYTVMPFGKHAGQHFKEFNAIQLEKIVNASAEQFPQLTDKHKRNAGYWLKKKQETAE
jgi:hypothetical protein